MTAQSPRTGRIGGGGWKQDFEHLGNGAMAVLGAGTSVLLQYRSPHRANQIRIKAREGAARTYRRGPMRHRLKFTLSAACMTTETGRR